MSPCECCDASDRFEPRSVLVSGSRAAVHRLVAPRPPRTSLQPAAAPLEGRARGEVGRRAGTSSSVPLPSRPSRRQTLNLVLFSRRQGAFGMKQDKGDFEQLLDKMLDSQKVFFVGPASQMKKGAQ